MATTTNPDQKVLQDLFTLSEQITLCQSILVNTTTSVGPTSIDANEALLSVIGFLESCVPRMVELIEAAAQGALNEGTFEECLVVNDRLTNVLADVDKDPKDRQPLTPAATLSAVVTNAVGDSTGGQNIDIDESMSKMSVTGGDADAVVGGKTTGLESEDIVSKTTAVEDPFAGGLDLLAPTPSTASDPFTISDHSTGSVEAAEKTIGADGDDDFDAFFRDRTAAP